MIVVDANIIAYFFIEGDKSEAARQVHAKDGHWVVPGAWRHEFLNILTTSCLFAKLPLVTAQRIWRDAESMVQGKEYSPDMSEVLSLAYDGSITAYDAEYIFLAKSLDIPCVTEDKPLRGKFSGTAVSMDDFLKADGAPRVVRERRAGYSARRKR